MGKEDWQKLIKFAEEEGFDVRSLKKSNDCILLPLEQISNFEHGVALIKGVALNPLAYVLDHKFNNIVFSEENIDCYTPEMVIKTAEIEDKKYIIERQEKEEIDKARGLILAFKFKDLGTIDPEFLYNIYTGVVEKLPKDIAKEVIKSKISELEEKLDEAEAADIPEKEKIIANIMNEFTTYVELVIHAQLELDIGSSNLTEKGLQHIIESIEFQSYYERYDDLLGVDEFVNYAEGCTKIGHPNIDYSIALLISDKILELEEKLTALHKTKPTQITHERKQNILYNFIRYMAAARAWQISPTFLHIEFPNLAKEFLSHMLENLNQGSCCKKLIEFVGWYKEMDEKIHVMYHYLQERYIYLLTREEHDCIRALQNITGFEPILRPEDFVGDKTIYDISDLRLAHKRYTERTLFNVRTEDYKKIINRIISDLEAKRQL